MSRSGQCGSGGWQTGDTFSFAWLIEEQEKGGKEKLSED